MRKTLQTLMLGAAMMVSPAFAEASHTWYGLYFDTAECKLAPMSPLETYNYVVAGGLPGAVFERIAPANVTHYPNGNVAVELKGTLYGKETGLFFFTRKSDCERVLRDGNIAADQAPERDIN